MTQRKKIIWILILQGWAMLWVVIGHAFLGSISCKAEWPAYARVLMDIAYSFHMPLSMFVSGYLFYLTRLAPVQLGGTIWSYKSIIKDKAIRLLLPGLVFTMIAFAVKIVVPGEVKRQTSIGFDEIVHAIVYPYDNPFREMWFIATLFIFFLMTPLWKIALKHTWTIWTTIIALVILHFIHPSSWMFCINRVCTHAIWFFMGIILSRIDLVEKFIDINKWLVLLFGVVIYFIGLYTLGELKTIGGIASSIALAMLLDAYYSKVFFSFRNYTYQIFLIGIFAQMAVKIFYRHVHVAYIVAYVVCILMGIYVPVIISKILERLNWKPLLMCVGLRVKTK